MIEPDRYAVVGNPIAHSQSPWLHAQFAQLTQQNLSYGHILAPKHGFMQTIIAMQAAGMKGANITVPFKFEAFSMCHDLTDRAKIAGAVNTIQFLPNRLILGDNTDGVGLCMDLQRILGGLSGLRVLLLGAGGAVAGVLAPLMAAGVKQLFVLNRTPEKAHVLLQPLQSRYPNVQCQAGGLDMSGRSVDVVINGAASSLSGQAVSIDTAWFSQARLAYDMMYGAKPTPFMLQAQLQGIMSCDGIGMLVGQAVCAFEFWREIRPPFESVLQMFAAKLGRFN